MISRHLESTADHRIPFWPRWKWKLWESSTVGGP